MIEIDTFDKKSTRKTS